MEVSDKLMELTEGIHTLCNRIVYVKESNNIRVIRVFDLFNQKEEIYCFEEL